VRQQHLVRDLAAPQARLARESASAERRPLAREVHDAVAHSLGVTMLHLTGARYLVRSDPEAALTALAEAERIGRASMADIRRTIGLLRAEGSAPIVQD